MIRDLPPILRRDYRRNVLWPAVGLAALAASLALIGLVVFGLVGAPAEDFAADWIREACR